MGLPMTALIFFCLLLICDVMPNCVFHWHIHGTKTNLTKAATKESAVAEIREDQRVREYSGEQLQ